MTPRTMLKLTYGLYVVGVKDNDKFAGCIVDAVMQTTVTPECLVICCNKSTKTSECIQNTKEFTLSILPEDTDPFVICTFGFQSSRTVDKWAKICHEIKDGLPVLKNVSAYLKCVVTESKDLSTHTLFFCNVVDGEETDKKSLSYTAYQECWKPRVMEAFKAGRSLIETTNGDNKMTNDAKKDPRLDEKWVCSVCGYVYEGDVAFEDLPDTYECPVCIQPKAVFNKE